MKTVFVTGGSGFVGRNLIEALVARGDRVLALARSDGAAREVAARGAEPVRGDLDPSGAYADRIAGASTIFHVAAKAEDWGDPAEFERVNVQGTEGVIAAARRARVPALVHVSTEAVLVGRPIVRADETLPIPERPLGLYPASKALAERRVVAANGDGLRTVVVRPRFVWGRGDTTLLPRLVTLAREGRFAWIGGGRHLTSTTHVKNTVEGLLCAESAGRGGEVYFVTDGEPVEVRQFIGALLATQGVDAGSRSIPFWLARTVAGASERWVRMTRSSRPPLMTVTAAHLIGREVTLDDAKARREIGYVGRMSREAGLAELA